MIPCRSREESSRARRGGDRRRNEWAAIDLSKTARRGVAPFGLTPYPLSAVRPPPCAPFLAEREMESQRGWGPKAPGPPVWPPPPPPVPPCWAAAPQRGG